MLMISGVRTAVRTMSTKVAAAQNALKQSTCVAFDVDSTVTTGEGLDDLAAFCGKGEEVLPLKILYFPTSISQSLI